MELILLASSRTPILSLKCPKKVAPQNTFYTRLSDDIFSITASFCLNVPSSPRCYLSNDIIESLRAQGEVIEDETLAHISLLPYKHVVPNGTYFIDDL